MKKNSFLKEIILSSAAVALALPMPVSAQTQKVSLNFRNVSPRQLFRAIEKQTTYRFSFRDMTVDQKKDITVNCKEQTVKSVLEQVLAKRGLTYKMVSDKDITVMPVGHDAATPQAKPAQQRGTQQKSKMVRGHIVDDHGEPIVGAVVRDTQEAVRKVVRMERRVETFAEGQRFTDIRRWVIADQIPELDGPAEGMNWQSTVDADFFKRTKLLDHVRTWDDKWYWMPLPQSEVDKNTNLVQAPGW